MFCKNCGQRIEGQQNFCVFCGANISLVHYDHSIREKEMNLVDYLIDFFMQKKELYNRYDTVAKDINDLKYVRAKAALVWGIILLASMTSLSFIYLMEFLPLMMEYESLVLVIIFPLILALPGIALIFVFISLNKNREAKLKIAINEYSYLSQALLDYYTLCENCPVGIEYTNPSTLLAIKNILRSGRADTIKEAINIVLDDAHRRKMEDLAAKTAQYVESNYKLTKVVAIASIADLLD